MRETETFSLQFFRESGKMGGTARAAKLTKEQRIAIATHASRTRLRYQAERKAAAAETARSSPREESKKKKGI